MAFRWAAVRLYRGPRQHPRPLSSSISAPSQELGGLSLSLHRHSTHRSYTNRLSFQKTASTNEWEWICSAERFGAHGVLRGFSYKAKQWNSQNSCFSLSVCACGHFVNDQHISIQNLIAFLRSTLKEIQHQHTLDKKIKVRKKESSIRKQHKRFIWKTDCDPKKQREPVIRKKLQSEMRVSLPET